MGNQYHSLSFFSLNTLGLIQGGKSGPITNMSYEFSVLGPITNMRVMNSVCFARELCFTESVLCRHPVCFQVQWRLVVIRMVRAKGSLSHEPHQLVTGPYTGPLHSNTWQNLSPPWQPSVSDSSPPCQKVGHRCSWVGGCFFR